MISRRAVIEFVIRRRATIAQILALIAVLSMILSAYFFRPQPESLVRYRPTPGPKDYYDPRAPLAFAAGALALIGALALARHAVPSPTRAGGRLDALRPLWAWVLVVPGVILLFAAAEINGELVERLDRLWKASPHVQFVLLIGGTVLLAGGLGGAPVLWHRQGGRESAPSSEPPGDVPTRPRPPDSSTRKRLWPVDTVLKIEGNAPGRVLVAVKIQGAGLQTRPYNAMANGPANPLSIPRRGNSEARLAWLEVALVLTLTLIALGVRLYRLNTSVRMMIDEIHFALGTTYFWTFPDVNLLEPMPTTASFPFIFSYGQFGMVQLFGRTFLGLRAFSAILGALTIPATYALARELFDRRTAILAALVLLTFPPHVHYSRLALNNIADPLFGTLALVFLARALRLRRRMDYTLAGIMLGAAQYFYEGGRILFPALAFVWIGIGFIVWRPPPSLRGLILMGLACVIVAAPVYYTLEGVGFPLFDRIDKAQLDDYYWDRERESDNWQAREERFEHSLLHYINSPENTLFHFYLYYGGEHPLLLVYVVPPFLLGVVIAVWQWRKPGVVLVVWLLATTAGNALLVESAVSARYVLVFPALAILVALGIRVTLPMIWPAAWPDRAQTALMIGLAAILAAGQAVYYFGPHLDHFNAELRQQVAHDAEDAILRSVDFPPGTEIWLIGDGSMMGQADAQRAANFFADNLIIVVKAPLDVTAADLLALRRDHDLAFFLALDDRPTLDKLIAIYGPHELQHTPYHDVPPDKALVLFYVPAPQVLPDELGVYG